MKRIDNVLVTRTLKPFAKESPATKLQTGPGSANIVHQFNLDLYQEGFAYYRSTLLYYERLDGLDI